MKTWRRLLAVLLGTVGYVQAGWAQNIWELRDKNNNIHITIDSTTHNVGGTLGNVTSNSSVTASGFFGNGSQLSGVTATPSGSAGGDLTGTYPNPTIGAGKVTDSKVTLSTGAISSGQFGDQRVAISTGATSGTFGDDKVLISTGGLTGTVQIAHGGTGATSASGARTNLSAAQSGANSDITSASALATISDGLTVANSTVTITGSSGGYSLSTTGGVLAAAASSFNGLLDQGAQSATSIRALSCPTVDATHGCFVFNTTDFDVYYDTGSSAGQYRNGRTGVGP